MSLSPPNPSPIRTTDAESIALAKRLLRLARSASLASVGADGHPLATLTLCATAFDGTPVILVSQLSAHTRNLAAEPRVSLLASSHGKGDPLAHPRISLAARARFIGRDGEERPILRRRFLARHPKAALYADFGDFSFVALDPAGASLNGGFGKAYELGADELRARIDDAGELAEIEESALEHMNGGHADALQLYAAHFAGETPGKWRATGIDPEGLDLARGDACARVDFPRRVADGAQLRSVLKEMADAARAAAT